MASVTNKWRRLFDEFLIYEILSDIIVCFDFDTFKSNPKINLREFFKRRN